MELYKVHLHDHSSDEEYLGKLPPSAIGGGAQRSELSLHNILGETTLREGANVIVKSVLRELAVGAEGDLLVVHGDGVGVGV